MSDLLCRIEAVSTEIAVLVVCCLGAWTLGTESRDLLIAALGGLLGYLTRRLPQ